MNKKFKSVLLYISKNYQIVAFFSLILILILLNSIHFFYQDEFENILGGFYITQGRLPYTGFFIHHAPFPYFLAALISIISGRSFVIFRIVYGLLQFLSMIGFYRYFRFKFGLIWSKIMLVFLLILTISSTYFWAHMLLADSLAGFLIVPAYMIVFLSILERQELTVKDLIFISLLLAFTVLTSFTYIYAVAILYILSLVWFYKFSHHKLISHQTIKILTLLALPYLIFGLYLLLTRSWSDFYYQAIYFNQEYYVKMPDGSPARNPIRLAVVIFDLFFDRFRAALLSIKDFNLGDPIAATLALSNLIVILYLIIKRLYWLGFIVFILGVYLCARVNPQAITETDYQAVPYVFFSLFNGLTVLYLMTNSIKSNSSDHLKFSFNIAAFVLGLFWFFSILLLVNKDLEKVYTKYMGTLPLIYDRPIVAPYLNQILTSKDYYFIGPFDFQEQLYTKAKVASRYIVTIPAMDQSDKIKSEMITDFEIHKPQVVVFNTDDQIFGSYPGRFLLDYLMKNYFTMDQINHPTKKYDYTHNSFGPYDRYDFARHFFFRKDQKDEILKKLVDNNLIKPI